MLNSWHQRAQSVMLGRAWHSRISHTPQQPGSGVGEGGRKRERWGGKEREKEGQREGERKEGRKRKRDTRRGCE